MSNTILISGASETLNVSVNPTLINVSVAIEEAAVTNTLEVNQFAGAYVSTIEGGYGIEVDTAGKVYTISLADDISDIESDPVFVASPAYTITSQLITNWNSAGPGLQSVSFNTADGVLTITDTEGTDFTASLDGRYLQTETVTTISLANNVVSYVDEDGVTTDIDLSAYLDNTNDFVSSGTFTDGSLTLSIPNQGDVIINLDGRYLRSVGSLTDNFFGVYDSSTGQLVDAPAKFIDGNNPSVEFFDNTIADKGSVSLEFNALAGNALPDPDATVNSVSTIENVSVSLNTTTVTVYDSSRDLFYAFYKQSADSTLRYDVFNLSGERTVSYQVLLTGIDFGTRSIGPSLYSADLDVLFIPLGNSEGSNEVYVINPSDFSVVDSANFGVVTPSAPFGNLYYTTRGSHYSHSLGSVFLSQSGGTVSVLDFDGSTLSNHRSIDAVDNEAFRTSIYGVFEDTDNSNVYCVDEYRYVYIYSNANDTFTYIGSRLPEKSSLTNIVFVPGSGSVWIRYSDNELTTDTLAKYSLSDFSLTTIETYTIENNSDATDRLYIQYNEYDQSVYATSFGTIDVYDTSTDTSIFTSTVLDIKGLLGETVMFSTVEDKMFVFTYTVIQESIRDYSSAIKLKYGSYTQIEGDAPVDPKLDIELTADGANYVAHSGDTISHHFFTNDSEGEDTKVLSIGDQTLYVFNTDGENSTITKAKIDSWDGYGAGLDSVSFNTANGLLTITDTAAVEYSVSLEGRYLTEETVTSISFSENSLTYTDENSSDTVIDLSAYLDNTDTTYDLSSKENVTEGVDIDLTAGGDGSGVDTVTIVGTNDITVSTSGNVITIDAPHETTTSISLTANSLDYVDEDGGTTSIDLSPYLDNENDFVTTASFADGVLTLGVSNQNDVTVNLDGRYLQSETTTSLSFADNTLTYTDEEGAPTNIDLSIYEETNTSLSFNTETSILTYTDEDGTANAIDISSLEETNTVLTFNGETSILTYTDEVGTENVVDISSLEETLTSLSFSGETNALTYTDEDGTENVVSIDSLSETLTSLSYNGTNQTLTYTDEDGNDTALDISETVTSVSFTGDTLTYTDEGGTDTAIDLSKYNETLTSISFTGDTLTYTDEDGTDTAIDLSKYNETLTSISFTGDTITYTDENGADTALDLSKYNETLTSLSFAGTTLTYTDEDGDDTAIDISSLSGDTTYDLVSAANATSGADLKLTGSDATTDTVNIIGTNAVTVTGAAGTITIDAPEETTTSLSYASGSLTYTDEDGADTVLDISGLSGDTTYTVTATDNATDGVDVNLVGSDSSTDTLTVVGSGDVTVTQSSDTITINAPHETTTSLSYANDTLTYTNEDGAATNINLGGFNETLTTLSIASNILKYTDEEGIETDINLSLYLDDTNLARLTSGTLDGATGIATFTRDDASTFTVDFSALLDDTDTDTTYDLSTDDNATAGVDLNLTAGGDGSGTDTVTFKGANAVTVTQASNVVTIDVPSGVNDFVDGASFNTADGVLTLSVSNQSDVTVDLDGRYLRSESDTLDSVTDRGNTTDNSIELLDGATLTVKANSNAAAASLGYIGDHLYISHLASSTTSATVIKSKYNGSRIIIGGNDASGSLVAQDAVNFYSGGGVFRFYEDPAAGTTTVSASDVFMGTLTVYRDLTVQDDASVGGDLEVTGSATFLGGFSNSSIRYKKNIQDLEDRTDDVMRLRPVRYELKSNDKKDIGLIAEEVEQIFPEVIGYKDGEVNGIDYAKLSVVFLQQIQKQQSLIDILEERITKLENK